MENSKPNLVVRTIPMAQLKKGMMIREFTDIPFVFKNLTNNAIKFLIKFEFKNITIERSGESVEVDASGLKPGDRVLHLGLLHRPLNVTTDSTLHLLQSIGFKKIKVLLKPEEEAKAVNSEKQTSITVRNKREISKKNIKQLQDSMQESKKLIEKGYDIIHDIFENSRRHVFQIESAKELAKDLLHSIRKSKYATNVLSVLKSHDEYTFNHCLDVANQLAMVYSDLSKRDNMVDLETVSLGGLLHDIGKSQIPLEVLNKSGPLDDTEWKSMKQHPLLGAKILASLKLGKEIISIAYYHHVKKNGKGYPEKEYNKIGELAKITSLADVYQALVTKRPYKPSLPPHIALEKISELSSVDYDEELAFNFIKTLGVYPIGSLVSLTNNMSGFVVGWSEVSIRPQIVVVLDTNETVMEHKELIDLSTPEYNSLSILDTLDHRKYFGDDATDIFMNLDV